APRRPKPTPRGWPAWPRRPGAAYGWSWKRKPKRAPRSDSVPTSPAVVADRGSVPPNQHHRHVVRAAAIQRRRDQAIDAFLRAAFAVREHLRDMTVIHFLGQPVAAQQQLHARAQL